jgi:hypothetical protein
MNIFNNDPNWFVFEINMRLETFLRRFKNVSEYYRQISNSKRMWNRKSNREFFKNINEGFYRTSINDEQITITFFLSFLPNPKLFSMITELRIRIKKIQMCRIDTLPLSEISNEDRLLLSSSNGISFYQKIRKTEPFQKQEILA